MKTKVNVSIGSLELRNNHKSNPLTSNEMEIVKWQGQTCFTVGLWSVGSDSFKFIGSRPLEECWDTLRKLIVIGQGFIEGDE